MKKTSTKKALICLGVLFFLLWSFIVSAITIDPWRFVATMRIQQVNLYYRITSTNSELEKDDIVKAWMTNYWWVDKWVLYIRPVDYTGNLVDETNNVVTNPDYASIIWWQMNINNGDETTIMLWWSKNTAGGHWVVLMWWDSNTATVDNAVILWSHKSTVWSTNWVIMASDGWSVYWNNSTIFGWGWLIATWADNSFAIGWGVTINHQWVFSYGWWTSLKPNIAQFNGWQWVIVWWTKPNGNGHIKLSVNWALAVWRGQCSEGMIWSIYYKAGTQETSDGHYTPTYCLCACVTSGSAYREIALSNQPYCNGVCECQSEDPNQCHPSPVKCWTRWSLSGSTPMAYAHWEKWWRVASRFCEDNRPPRAYQVYSGWAPVPWKSNDCWVSSAACNPPFPEPGETVKWICHWVWYYDDTECSAYRDLEAPELAECGKNSRRYNYYDTGWDWTKESDFCRHLNWAGSGDRSHNWELTEFRTLTEEEVEIEYKSGILLVPYATWEDYLQILNKLKSPGGFPVPGWRTYWKCETSNAWNEVWGREVTNEKICYADRMPCNTCAKDGFPYCFSVNFSDECNCTDPAECHVPCLPGSEHAWENELHISWNTQEVTDSLRIANNEIDNVRNEGGEGDNFSSEIVGQEVIYRFKKKNDTEEVKKYRARFTTVTGSVYCSWTTTISQCPKWFEYNEAQQKCVKEWYTIKFYCWTKSTSTMSDQQMEVWVEKALNKSLCKATWFVFTWWSTTENSTLIAYKDQQKVKDLWSAWSTVKLYAVYDEVYVPQYAVVKFNRNGGTSWTMADQQFEVWISQKLSKNVFSRDWYTFSWWNRKTDGSGPSYVDEASIKFTTSWTVTLYAQWTPIPPVVTYECMGQVPVDNDDPNKYLLANTYKPDRAGVHYFLASGDEYSQPCAYKCWPGYVTLELGDVRYCAKCKPWTVPDYAHWICTYEGDVTCPKPYVWFEKLKLCAIPGECSSYPTDMEQTPEEIQPIYGGTTYPRCVDDAASVEPNTCQYSCANGYICKYNQCVKPSCYRAGYNSPVYTVDHWNQNNYVQNWKLYYDALNDLNYPNRDQVLSENRMYAGFRDTARYYNLHPIVGHWSFRYTFLKSSDSNVIKKYQNPSMIDEDWFFVEASSETEFNQKVAWLTWCFFWCPASLYKENYDDYEGVDYTCWLPPKIDGWWNQNEWGWTAPQTEYEQNLCSSLSVSWPHGTSKTMWLKSQHPSAPYSWTWDTYANRKENEYCHAWCLEWYQRKVVYGINYCGKVCPSNQYIDYDYNCHPCPEGSVPDTSDKDEFWNAKSCWKNCNKDVNPPIYIAVHNDCVACPAGQTPDFSRNLDSHWNPTRCKNVCNDDEAYLNWWSNCWKGVNECCLPVVHDGVKRWCDKEDTECWTLENWTTCVCPVII